MRDARYKSQKEALDTLSSRLAKGWQDIGASAQLIARDLLRVGIKPSGVGFESDEVKELEKYMNNYSKSLTWYDALFKIRRNPQGPIDFKRKNDDEWEAGMSA